MVQHTQLLLNSLRIYAHHGVLPQERAVGAWFTLNLRLDTDFSEAIQSDCLDGTVSYADVYEVIKSEMAVPSNLLEHVAGRIINALFHSFPAVTRIHLEMLKDNPPMGAECAGAGISIDAVPISD